MSSYTRQIDHHNHAFVRNTGYGGCQQQQNPRRERLSDLENMLNRSGTWASKLGSNTPRSNTPRHRPMNSSCNRFANRNASKFSPQKQTSPLSYPKTKISNLVEPTQTKVGFQYFCQLCNKSMNSRVSYQSHVSGKIHMNRLAKQKSVMNRNCQSDHALLDMDMRRQMSGGNTNNCQRRPNSRPYSCEVCKVTMSSVDNLRDHLSGSKHYKRMQKQRAQLISGPIQLDKCKKCNVGFLWKCDSCANINYGWRMVCNMKHCKQPKRIHHGHVYEPMADKRRAADEHFCAYKLNPVAMEKDQIALETAIGLAKKREENGGEAREAELLAQQMEELKDALVVVTVRSMRVTCSPGPLGVEGYWNTGELKTVNKGQLSDVGVQSGWSIIKINGEDYSEAALDRVLMGNRNYTLTFDIQTTKTVSEEENATEEMLYQKLLREKTYTTAAAIARKRFWPKDQDFTKEDTDDGEATQLNACTSAVGNKSDPTRDPEPVKDTNDNSRLSVSPVDRGLTNGNEFFIADSSFSSHSEVPEKMELSYSMEGNNCVNTNSRSPSQYSTKAPSSVGSNGSNNSNYNNSHNSPVSEAELMSDWLNLKESHSANALLKRLSDMAKELQSVKNERDVLQNKLGKANRKSEALIGLVNDLETKNTEMQAIVSEVSEENEVLKKQFLPIPHYNQIPDDMHLFLDDNTLDQWLDERQHELGVNVDY